MRRRTKAARGKAMAHMNTETNTKAENEAQAVEAAAPKSIDERRKAVRAALQAELEARGHRWEERGGEWSPTVDGVLLHLEISEEGRGGWRRQHGNGRLRLKFGGYGDVRQFPEPKAGFDARKIAEEIAIYVKGCLAQRKREQEASARLQTNRAIADAINAELGLSTFMGPRADVESRTGRLIVRIDAALNEEQARALLAFTKKLTGQG
jgi:hypothetical protein